MQDADQNGVRAAARRATAGRGRRRFVSWAAGFGLSLAAASLSGGGAARADELKLDDGELLHGTVTAADAENVKVKHAVGGEELTIPWKQILSISTDAPVELKTLDGSRLKGKLMPGPAPHTLSIAPDAAQGPPPTGGVTFDRIAAINEPPSDAALNGRIALGITVSDGNTRQQTYFGSVDGERLTKLDRIELHAYYAYGTTEHLLATKKGFARAQYSLYFWRPLYVYVGGAFEYDHLQSLDLRSRGGAGLGWAIVESKDLVARLEAGGEYVNEDWSAPIEDDRFLTLRFATHLEWQVIPNVLRLAEDAELLPSTKQLRNFTSRSTTSANLAVYKGFGLAGIIIWQHVELPPDDVLRDDTTYILTLTYVF
ncbi:MAG TPA: DUF481 domain-containing protein [Planctomycetota bacterium]|nr:DUF481 domain-containing protein [Planctomycetota bacterium]